MSEEKINAIALGADLIVAGFAFSYDKEIGFVRVLNLNNVEQACVLDLDGNYVETTMDDKTLYLAQAYYLKNREFLEV